jgi:hypothetical protein
MSEVDGFSPAPSMVDNVLCKEVPSTIDYAADQSTHFSTIPGGQ